MARTYEDLSRRALIRLGHDYDNLNDDKLKKFLEHNDELYEDIRPIECIVDGCDQAVETIFGSNICIKDSVCSAGGTLISNIASSLADAASNVITAGAKHLVGMM